jgi:plastocyanin
MPPPMPLVRTLAGLLAAAALAGCGGAGPVTQASGDRLAIELDDFLIQPQNVRARAGRLTFEVTNGGRLGHNVRLRGGSEGEQVVTATLLPGKGATKSLNLAPGHYTMLCTVANHEQLGMTGRLVVR